MRGNKQRCPRPPEIALRRRTAPPGFLPRSLPSVKQHSAHGPAWPFGCFLPDRCVPGLFLTDSAWTITLLWPLLPEARVTYLFAFSPGAAERLTGRRLGNVVVSGHRTWVQAPALTLTVSSPTSYSTSASSLSFTCKIEIIIVHFSWSFVLNIKENHILVI